MLNRKFITQLLALVAAAIFTTTAYAGHSWSTYHWESSTKSALSLNLGDNVDSNWDDYLGSASGDWNASVITTTVVSGSTSARRCKAQNGNVQVCNLTYGYNGWLGIAGISISSGHITKGYVKLNDSYFNAAAYDTPAWRQFVTCQEIGHTFGLGHVNVDFDDVNTGSCMDYTDDPDGTIDGGLSNETPNTHDYELLKSMYAHEHVEEEPPVDDGGGGGGPSCKGGPKRCGSVSVPNGWGRLVSKHGPQEVFELDLGNGNKQVTHVTWTLEHADNHSH